MRPRTGLLLVHVGETDRWDGKPLYEAIIRRLLELGIGRSDGSSWGYRYGVHSHLHHKGLFGISDNRPVSITAVDRKRSGNPEVRVIVKKGGLLDIEVVSSVADSSGEGRCRELMVCTRCPV